MTVEAVAEIARDALYLIIKVSLPVLLVSLVIGLAISILIFCYALRQVEAVVLQFEKIRSYLNGAESYLSILLKVIGITYICEFSAGICKDAGYQAVAGQIEVLGKLSVMFAGLPILFAVIEQIQSFL